MLKRDSVESVVKIRVALLLLALACAASFHIT